MPKARYLLVFALLCSTGVAQPRTSPVFVSPQWLSDHLGDPGLVVLHVAFSRPEYQVGHIPGSRFLWYDWLVTSTPDASTEMPSSVQADTVLEGLGVTDSSRIVLVFTGTNITFAARIFLTLEYFGIGHNASILDGGLEAWKSGGRPLTKDVPGHPRTRLVVHPETKVTVNAEEVRSGLADPHTAIIDARDRRFYDGVGGGIGRPGHIRGARSIPYSSLLDSTTHILDHASLEKTLSAAGIDPSMRLFVYCHVGQQASLVYAAARALGYQAAVYDGSYQEWGLKGDEYPVERIPGTNH